MARTAAIDEWQTLKVPSCHKDSHAGIAQSGERRHHTAKVASSILAASTITINTIGNGSIILH